MPINITGVDLKKFVKEVYNLSQPQGLGILHYREGGLTDEEAESILAEGTPHHPVDMDYVHGRACKMVVFNNDDKLTIPDRWYDHTDNQLIELLKRCGVDR